jgi:hypothetical protein
MARCRSRFDALRLRWLVFYRVPLRSGLRAESRAPRSMPQEEFESSGCRRATGQFPPVLVDFSRSRERHQPSSRAIHVSGQSDFRREPANRTDRAATEDPGEGVSHGPILVDIETLLPFIPPKAPTARRTGVLGSPHHALPSLSPPSTGSSGQRRLADHTRHGCGQCSGWTAISWPRSRERGTRHGFGG